MHEEALIGKMKRGDRKAFDELFLMHWRAVAGFAEMIVGPRHADDIAQGVFLKLWERRDGMSPGGNLRAWLLKTAYRDCLNLVRSDTYSRTYRSDYARSIEALTLEQFDPERNGIIRRLYSTETGAAIREAVESLPGRCRQVFAMSYFDGMAHKDIADLLGISVSTVNNQVFKALGILREELKDFR